MSTRNISGVAANLRSFDADLKVEVRRLAQKHGKLVQARTRELCAYDTGFMHDNVRAELTPNGYGFEVGWRDEDFTARGFAFYPIFVEFGTSKMVAQPALFPAAAEDRPKYQRDLSAAIRKSTRRYGIR